VKNAIPNQTIHTGISEGNANLSLAGIRSRSFVALRFVAVEGGEEHNSPPLERRREPATGGNFYGTASARSLGSGGRSEGMPYVGILSGTLRTTITTNHSTRVSPGTNRSNRVGFTRSPSFDTCDDQLLRVAIRPPQPDANCLAIRGGPRAIAGVDDAPVSRVAATHDGLTLSVQWIRRTQSNTGVHVGRSPTGGRQARIRVGETIDRLEKLPRQCCGDLTGVRALILSDAGALDYDGCKAADGDQEQRDEDLDERDPVTTPLTRQLIGTPRQQSSSAQGRCRNRKASRSVA